MTVTWDDGTSSEYPIAYLRRMSPSAEQRELRREMEENPLAVLPDSIARHEGPLTAIDAELIGSYAIKIKFSDGHDTGIFSWTYLRQIDPATADADA